MGFLTLLRARVVQLDRWQRIAVNGCISGVLKSKRAYNVRLFHAKKDSFRAKMHPNGTKFYEKIPLMRRKSWIFRDSASP
jgi:hypothetical protein